MKKTKLNWVTTPFFILVPTISIIGTFLVITQSGLHWATLLVALLFTLATGLAITAGYHRLFSHKSYETNNLVKFIYLFFGAAAYEGSALEWCTDHRNHHRYTDTPKDPYNIKQGFWYAHIGWIFTLDTTKRNFGNVDDLQKDKLIALQHRFYGITALSTCFLLPTGICALWGDPWGGLFIAGGLRVTLNHHFTFFINSVCHYFGKQTYSESNTARDNWFTAFFTYGEGFHNFHHQFPLDYRNGIKSYHFDPSKWLIFALAKLGLATKLRRVNDSIIIRHKLQMDEKRLQKYQGGSSWLEHSTNAMTPMREKILGALSNLEQLEKSYYELKAKRLNQLQETVEEYRKTLAQYNEQIKQAKRELRVYLRSWEDLLRTTRLQEA